MPEDCPQNTRHPIDWNQVDLDRVRCNMAVIRGCIRQSSRPNAPHEARADIPWLEDVLDIFTDAEIKSMQQTPRPSQENPNTQNYDPREDYPSA
jgi:hypothetical protein